LHENAEETEPEETETEIQEVEPSILSEADVLTVLSNSKLPKISIDRLLKGNYLSEAELLTTVQAEKDYIKSLVGSGEPKALGETAPVVEQLSEAEILEDHNKRINRVIFGN